MDISGRTIKSLEFVLFIKDYPKKINKLNVAASISDNIDVLNGESTILPIPEDAPFEIPRIILQSSVYTCQISFIKIVFQRRFVQQIFDITFIEDFFIYVKKLFEVLTDKGFTFYRIGLVAQGELFVNPLDFVKQNFIKESISFDGFNIGLFNNVKEKGFLLNRWVRMDNNKENDKLIYHIDYNTKETPDIELTSSALEEILSILTQLNNIDNLFPES